MNYTITNELTNPLATRNLDLPIHCQVRSNAWSKECLIKTLCPQMNEYYINMGLTIIISTIIIYWFCWWFFKYGYKKLPDKKHKFWGNIHIRETRIYWDTWIRNKLSKLMLGYIVVIVYMNW